MHKDRGLSLLQYEKHTLLINSLLYNPEIREDRQNLKGLKGGFQVGKLPSSVNGRLLSDVTMSTVSVT